MGPRIVFVKQFTITDELVREIAPADFDLAIVDAGSPEYEAAIGKAEYLVGFVDASIDDALYAAAPRLKLIQMMSAGYDRADLAAARRAGVPVANNGGANSVAVSEHAMLLMLAVSRRLISQHANVVAGRWRGNTTPKLHELYGKTLGIVGLGTIGKKTARLAAAFGMNVNYYDIVRLPEDGADALGVEFRLLGELMRSSDVISLHVPLNDSTEGMIGTDELALLQPTSIIVNTSRGPVIDEAALIEALSTGALAGAGLDVLTEEPPAADNPLFALDNVVLTPHMAGPTWESNISRLRNCLDNVQRVARGEAPLWVIPELDD